MRTGIYVTLNAKGRSFAYLFIKLIFRQSDFICIGPLFYYLATLKTTIVTQMG